jgi:hypothetical protein
MEWQSTVEVAAGEERYMCTDETLAVSGTPSARRSQPERGSLPDRIAALIGVRRLARQTLFT